MLLAAWSAFAGCCVVSVFSIQCYCCVQYLAGVLRVLGLVPITNRCCYCCVGVACPCNYRLLCWLAGWVLNNRFGGQCVLCVRRTTAGYCEDPYANLRYYCSRLHHQTVRQQWPPEALVATTVAS